MGGPADQARLRERRQFFGERIFGVLLGIGGDDFEIAAGAQGEQGVLSAAAGMDAAERGPDASALFDEVDAALQIVAAEKDVVEHWRHLCDVARHAGFFELICEEKLWRESGSGAELQEGSSGKLHGVG